jgi:hypothetical protein
MSGRKFYDVSVNYKDKSGKFKRDKELDQIADKHRAVSTASGSMGDSRDVHYENIFPQHVAKFVGELKNKKFNTTAIREKKLDPEGEEIEGSHREIKEHQLPHWKEK